jgi:hypothetical protein
MSRARTVLGSAIAALVGCTVGSLELARKECPCTEGNEMAGRVVKVAK